MDLSTLIKEAKQKSAAAQKCLFDLYADKMIMVCLRYIKNKEDAEEILLNGFGRFLKSIQSFQYRDQPALHAWLKKIMINECLAFLRKKKVFTISPMQRHTMFPPASIFSQAFQQRKYFQ